MQKNREIKSKGGKEREKARGGRKEVELQRQREKGWRG